MSSDVRNAIYNEFKASKKSNLFLFCKLYLQHDCEILLKLIQRLFENYLLSENMNFICQEKFTISSIGYEQFFIRY